MLNRPSSYAVKTPRGTQKVQMTVYTKFRLVYTLLFVDYQFITK